MVSIAIIILIFSNVKIPTVFSPTPDKTSIITAQALLIIMLAIYSIGATVLLAIINYRSNKYMKIIEDLRINDK